MPGFRRAWSPAAARSAVALWFLVAGLVGGSGCRSSRAGGPGAADAAADRGGDATGGGGGAPGGDGADARTDGATDGGPGADAPAGADVRPGTDAGDGSAGADGVPADGVDAGFGAGCNTVATGAPVTVTCAGDGGVAPAPAGGTIVPGTYVLTAVTVYGACAAVDVAQTLVVTANSVETVINDPIDGLSRANATYAIAGNNMVQTNTCPNTDTRTLGFSVATSAGGTTLTLISTDTSNTTVGVLTRQ